MLCKGCSAIAKTSINTVLVTNAKDSTIGHAVKKINSIPDRPGIAVQEQNWSHNTVSLWDALKTSPVLFVNSPSRLPNLQGPSLEYSKYGTLP